MRVDSAQVRVKLQRAAGNRRGWAAAQDAHFAGTQRRIDVASSAVKRRAGRRGKRRQAKPQRRGPDDVRVDHHHSIGPQQRGHRRGRAGDRLAVASAGGSSATRRIADAISSDRSAGTSRCAASHIVWTGPHRIEAAARGKFETHRQEQTRAGRGGNPQRQAIGGRQHPHPAATALPAGRETTVRVRPVPARCRATPPVRQRTRTLGRPTSLPRSRSDQTRCRRDFRRPATPGVQARNSASGKCCDQPAPEGRRDQIQRQAAEAGNRRRRSSRVEKLDPPIRDRVRDFGLAKARHRDIDPMRRPPGIGNPTGPTGPNHSGWRWRSGESIAIWPGAISSISRKPGPRCQFGRQRSGPVRRIR